MQPVPIDDGLLARIDAQFASLLPADDAIGVAIALGLTLSSS